ncbi:MAG: hypothetical protein ACQEXX_00285 [Bacillota bacterium]
MSDLTVRQNRIALPEYPSLDELENADSGWFTDRQSLISYYKEMAI